MLVLIVNCEIEMNTIDPSMILFASPFLWCVLMMIVPFFKWLINTKMRAQYK